MQSVAAAKPKVTDVGAAAPHSRAMASNGQAGSKGQQPFSGLQLVLRTILQETSLGVLSLVALLSCCGVEVPPLAMTLASKCSSSFPNVLKGATHVGHERRDCTEVLNLAMQAPCLM